MALHPIMAGILKQFARSPVEALADVEKCDQCGEPGAVACIHEMSDDRSADDHAQWLCPDCQKRMDFIPMDKPAPARREGEES